MHKDLSNLPAPSRDDDPMKSNARNLNSGANYKCAMTAFNALESLKVNKCLANHALMLF